MSSPSPTIRLSNRALPSFNSDKWIRESLCLNSSARKLDNFKFVVIAATNLIQLADEMRN